MANRKKSADATRVTAFSQGGITGSLMTSLPWFEVNGRYAATKANRMPIVMVGDVR